MLSDDYRNVCEGLFIKDIMTFVNAPSEDTASKFIQSYFEMHSKGILFNKCIAEPESMYSKSIHTVSAFLLGLEFQEICKAQVESQIIKNAPIDSQLFEYPWLLACLYHDVFSDYEINHEEKYPKTLSEFISKQKIEHKIFRFAIPDKIHLNYFKPIYKEISVEKYYEYRVNSNDPKVFGIDHGIISGYYAFDRLTKNFIDNWKQKDKQDEFNTNIDGHTLVWNKDQIWIFALVSDAIIAHNIWHTNNMNSVSMEFWTNANNKEEV